MIPQSNLSDVDTLNQFDLPGLNQFEIVGFEDLWNVVSWTFEHNFKVDETLKYKIPRDCTEAGLPNFDDMVLAPELEQAAIVMCAGLHSLMLYGTPGTGKSMFASRLTSIMPKMEQRDHMEALKIASSCRDQLPQELLAGRPPSRSPHHQASAAAILGTSDIPGELSLAHGGLLFMDEFPEFRRDIIEALREPLETGEVQVSRAKKKVLWKARICLVAAANNCPCGWYGSQKRKCRCPQTKIAAYRRRVSGQS